MTVTYSLNVSNARLCGFLKLLFRWKGSIYKLLYREMLIFCSVYAFLSILYRFVLNESQKRLFEKLSIYCETFTNLIPLSFVLGFYVSIVVGRWWQQYTAIPWPDKCVMLIGGIVQGKDERGRMTRRTLARYLILLSVLTFQAISTAVKKRFPTLDHIMEAGLMTKEERYMYDSIPVTHGKWWVPAQWFTSLACRARREGRVKDDVLLKALLDELHVYRGNCGTLFSYDWISIPLVYTQVVTIAIYVYFFATVMGRQFLSPEMGYSGHDVDLVIPSFTILQFFFYMGWLKVAEQLINPFGEDDDDFELNWCLDRNLQMVFVIVDEMHMNHPKLVKDMYWDDESPQLPYNKLSLNLQSSPHLGSTVNLDFNPEESEFIPLDTIVEEDHHHPYNSPPTSPPPPNEGFRIMNMLLTSSSTQDMGSKKDLPTLPSFTYKSPSHRSRNNSTTNCMDLNNDDDSHGGHSLYHHHFAMDRRQGEAINPEEHISFIAQSTFNEDLQGSPACAQTEPLISTNIEPNSQPQGGNSDSEMVVIEMEPETRVPLPTIEENCSHSEASSSQESLSQLMDSNQSTVSSMAELIRFSSSSSTCSE